MQIGILGGTFDPIHYGHLLIAEEVREQFKLDKILFVPTARPPHKRETTITDFRHRYKMALLATGNNPYFMVSDLEIFHLGKSYTIKTIKELEKKYKDKKLKIYFIIGTDSALEISTWKDIDELIELCKFITVPRPHYDLKKIDDKYKEKMCILKFPLVDISSIKIRERVKEERSIKYLVPELVEEYIYKNKLYK